MKGLELARQYYETFGAPMLTERFSSVLPQIAVGLCGSGSECFGYDDAISEDHDFEPGFCLFLPDEEKVDRRTAFLLERAYASLPKEFCGYRRSNLSPVGGNRHGVIRLSDFLRAKTGTPDGELSLGAWISLPEQSLGEVTNGALFHDGSGIFTAIRRRLSRFPEGVRRKKLAGELVMMGQAGQYNYPRCLKREESGAAQLAMQEFVKSAMHAVFLLNRVYQPYYKWSFRTLGELSLLSTLSAPLEFLITSGNSPSEAAVKTELCEDILSGIVAELKRQGLSSSASTSAEAHGYAVNDSIAEEEIRNLHILAAI